MVDEAFPPPSPAVVAPAAGPLQVPAQDPAAHPPQAPLVRRPEDPLRAAASAVQVEAAGALRAEGVRAWEPLDFPDAHTPASGPHALAGSFLAAWAAGRRVRASAAGPGEACLPRDPQARLQDRALRGAVAPQVVVASGPGAAALPSGPASVLAGAAVVRCPGAALVGVGGHSPGAAQAWAVLRRAALPAQDQAGVEARLRDRVAAHARVGGVRHPPAGS